jgi:hypothetical protein
MDEKKILLLDLSKGKVGEDNSALLGAMIITKLQLAALSRVDIPEKDRQDFYLYVDEFQNFVTESFATILSEARKYRLNLTDSFTTLGTYTYATLGAVISHFDRPGIPAAETLQLRVELLGTSTTTPQFKSLTLR